MVQPVHCQQHAAAACQPLLHPAWACMHQDARCWPRVQLCARCLAALTRCWPLCRDVADNNVECSNLPSWLLSFLGFVGAPFGYEKSISCSGEGRGRSAAAQAVTCCMAPAADMICCGAMLKARSPWWSPLLARCTAAAAHTAAVPGGWLCCRQLGASVKGCLAVPTASCCASVSNGSVSSRQLDIAMCMWRRRIQEPPFKQGPSTQQDGTPTSSTGQQDGRRQLPATSPCTIGPAPCCQVHEPRHRQPHAGNSPHAQQRGRCSGKPSYGCLGAAGSSRPCASGLGLDAGDHQGISSLQLIVLVGDILGLSSLWPGFVMRQVLLCSFATDWQHAGHQELL